MKLQSAAALFNVLVIFGFASTVYAAPNYTYHTIPEPANNEAEGNAGWGVSRSGVVLVAIFQANFDDAGAMGYSFANGTLTPLNYPDANFTVPHAMNKAGIVAGEAGINGISGFLMTKAEKFTAYDFPGASYTRFTGINDHGVASGNYYNGSFHGITYSKGTYTQFDFPGASGTSCTSINNSGEVVGNYQDGNNITHGYIKIGATPTSFDVKGATYTDARAVNDHGVAAGWWMDANNVSHGFLRARSGKITVINYPDATQTELFGINDAGEISGSWANSSGQWVPFYAIPAS